MFNWIFHFFSLSFWFITSRVLSAIDDFVLHSSLAIASRSLIQQSKDPLFAVIFLSELSCIIIYPLLGGTFSSSSAFCCQFFLSFHCEWKNPFLLFLGIVTSIIASWQTLDNFHCDVPLLFRRWFRTWFSAIFSWLFFYLHTIVSGEEQAQ